MEYKSSAAEFDRFMDSGIWEDMIHELKVWLSAIHINLEDPEAEEKILRRLGGNAETIRRVLMLPVMIRDNIIDDNKQEQKQSKEGE
uniref:Uncharacterized protein n=2 Tax=viral metagenome TaxID=1070528 RepID=A0A6M3K157_9ZZZZ